ncbi:hypothetical protein BST25_22945 [Mycobacterium heidelbergense]|uniref:Uncharacterized protein n=1 Tax=Mycobacterium heidelbergense TaxID=53376 RepID=A0A1X0D5S6_MYCHE|nr:hypothetical protein BST25_22945 [Mycobacterium heidelbergense]BBZ48690.1 hypothetical protein MHEI_04070 [Mycobacterium heidelbergense]
MASGGAGRSRPFYPRVSTREFRHPWFRDGAARQAEESGITLVAFLREDSMNIYTRADRIT